MIFGAQETDLKKMLDFVGMKAVVLSRSESRCRLKIVRDCGGLVSFGDGDTLSEAIESAMLGQSMDWRSIREKVFDRDCVDILHL